MELRTASEGDCSRFDDWVLIEFDTLIGPDTMRRSVGVTENPDRLAGAAARIDLTASAGIVVSRWLGVV